MGVPTKHKTSSKTRSRRSHHALSATHLARCANCGAAVMPHMACSACGYYRGRKTLEPKVKAKKSKRR